MKDGGGEKNKRCCPLKWTFCFLHSQSDLSTRTGTYCTTPLTPKGVVEPSPLSRSGESSSNATAESAEEIFSDGAKYI
jgi:hypothetical protein